MPAHARRFLEPALVRAGDHEWDEVERRVLADTAQLWMGDGCAIVTELFDKVIHGWLAGGSLAGILQLVPAIEKTAAFWGCSKVTLKGRRGWLRVFAPLGYRLNEDGELEKRLDVQ